MGDINLNFQLPIAQRMLPTPLLNSPKLPLMPKGTELRQLLLGKLASGTQFPTAKVAGIALDTILDKTNLFGGLFGNIFSSGLSSAGDTIFNNIIKGTTLTEGLGLNVGSSVAGTLSGLGANLVGQGINKIGGDSMLSRGIGLGVATGLGTIGGTALSNLISTGKIAGNASKLFGTGNNILTTTKTVKDAAGNIKNVSQVGAINPYALGASIVGTGLSAAFGPSKEYGGDYGNVTKTMDAAYDAIQGAVGFIPGYGQVVSGLMALNKGLSNVFGSTSGNTLQDAILGSAFMPAPVKWLNMAGKSTSRSVHNLSWQNTEKRRSFMGNAFGNIEDKIQTGIDHSNSTQGLFAKHYTNKFNRQVDFANRANDMLLAMADLNELQNIRSQYMSSINNQRYAQMIQGGYNPLAIGKLGMKILNNATNHNMGLRLLSAAALIDNKAMILSAQGGTKILRQRPTPLRRKPATREENPELWDEWEKREAELQTARLQVYNQELQATTQRAETNARHALHYSDLATGVAETALQNTLFEPVTQESLQNSNTERVRQELLADKNEYFDKGMDFINAAGFADLGVNVAGPLLQRGFKWAFDKAGNLVKIQKDIPRKAENFYRAVNKDAIDDANKYGIIRGRQDREDNYAFFGRSSEPYHDTKYVIEGTPESADWISTYKYAYNKNPEIVYLPKIPDRDYSKAYHTIIGSPEPNGFLKIGVYDSEFLEGYEALPSIKGQLNISPSSNFTYWKKYPIIGWRLHLFKNKVPIQKINLFLTSPYTGKWTLFGNREYRFKPGYAATNGVPVESRPLQITQENASSVTPEQWNAAYRAAYERGDKAEGKRLWTLWFRQRAKNNKLASENNFPVELKHNTDSEPWNIYDESHFNSATGDDGYYGKGLYASGNPLGKMAYGKNTMNLYGYMKDPAVVPPANIELNKLPDNFTTSYIAKDLFNRGVSKEDYIRNLDGEILEWYKEYPELISKAIDNVKKADGIIVQRGASGHLPFAPFDEVVLPKGTHIKLAEPFTLDDNGRLIDLTERANFSKNDNRYSWLPWFLGGSTTATLYNKSK